MAENTVKLETQFESLRAVVSSLNKADKHKLLEILEEELFEEDDLENDPQLVADIAAARAEYASGDYLTYQEFIAQRQKATS
jgi:hypothetical protein